MEPEQEVPRPANKADMLQIIDALETRGVDYILIGGHALQLHGYMRATEDVDFLLPLDEINGSKVIDALSILPDQASLEMESSWFADGENIRVNDEIIVDLLFVAANGETYESLSGHIIDVEIDGHSIKTLDLEGLLKTKVSTREKDIADYRVLALAIHEINKRKALDKDLSASLTEDKSVSESSAKAITDAPAIPEQVMTRRCDMPTVLMERNNLVNAFVRVDEETKKARASAQHEVGDKEWKQGFSEEKQETARNILKEQGVGYETALKGELQGVALAETKVNGEPQQKLRVALQKGEDRILLSADLDSEFAQRLVAKLDTLSQSPQKGEITIGAFASPKERDGRHFVDHVATLKGPDGKEIPAVSGHFEQAKELSEQAKKPMLDAGITEKKILEPIADAAREKYFAGLVTEISGRLKEQGITMETGQSNNPAPRLEAHVQEPNGTWHSVGVWADKEGKLVGSVAVQRPDGEKDRIPVIFQDKVSQKGVPMLQAAGERSDGARVYVSMMPHEAKSGEKFISASFAEKHPEQELVRIEGRGGGLKPNKTAMEQGVRNRTVQLVKEKLGVNVLENARTQDRGKQEGMEIGR